MLRAADSQTRQECLQTANANQINTVSELVMNVLRRRVPVPSRTVQRLQPHQVAIRHIWLVEKIL